MGVEPPLGRQDADEHAAQRHQTGKGADRADTGQYQNLSQSDFELLNFQGQQLEPVFKKTRADLADFGGGIAQCVRFLQPLKQKTIFVTFSGILGGSVRLSHSKKQLLRFVMPAGSKGAWVKLLQL